VVVPIYLQSRGQVLGGRAVPVAGSALTSSDQSRLRAWGTAIRMWTDSPVIGQGYASWARVRRAYGVRRLPNAHNELLMLLAEGGVLAGAAGVAFVGTSVRDLWRRRQWLSTGALGAFAAYCVAASFNGLLGFMQLTVVAFGALGAALGYAALARPPTHGRPSAESRVRSAAPEQAAS
jgi:O-antigen ligase